MPSDIQELLFYILILAIAGIISIPVSSAQAKVVHRMFSLFNRLRRKISIARSFRAGQRAHRKGRTPRDNPHANTNCPRHIAWNEGFLERQSAEEAERNYSNKDNRPDIF